MSLQQMVSSQCLTLGSRKFDCVLYNIFDQKLDSSVKHWNDITGALEFLFQYLYISHASEQIRKINLIEKTNQEWKDLYDEIVSGFQCQALE
ncbi:hypothetical protein [Wolbachia endosymbiont of Dactylopius coccus]|nr:MAG: hypothetical protein TV42_02020 [Wolbachia endosymbiont of Dactylopius coccus]